MTLREYYEKLKTLPRPLSPHQQFINDLVKITGRTPKTVRQWIYGSQPVPAEFRKKIEDILKEKCNGNKRT